MNLYKGELDEQYIQLLKEILSKDSKDDPKRKGVKRRSLPYKHLNIDVLDTAPILDCKRTYPLSAVKEFNFFINGKTNVSELGAKFWDMDAYNFYLRKLEHKNKYLTPLPFDRFKEVVGLPCPYINDYSYGDIGQVYGSLWAEQLPYVIKQMQDSINHTDMLVFNSDFRIKNKPLLRALEPCHYSWQVVATERGFGIILNMRSSDVFLGLPMNIQFYYLIGKYLEYKLDRSIRFSDMFLSLGNVHLYDNSFELAEKLISDYKPNDNVYYTEDNFRFVEGSNYVKCILGHNLTSLAYAEDTIVYSVPMLSQSNELLND